jgi:16S rRNA (cytosine967-C5)-methyltransferase
MKSTPAASTSPRIVRVRKAASAEQGRPNLQFGALPPDSLGRSLVLAAHVLAAVHAGRSLTEALALLASEPPAARAAAQDVAYGVLRRFGWGEYILGRLLSKPLSHPETQALLLGALYRLETRADSPHMVVDQAVSAAGELAGGVFKGLVNGVLRNYLRQREALLAELAADESARYQHPRWWLNRLRRSYPEQWEAIVQAGNTPPPMTLRVNLKQATREQYLSALEAAGLVAKPTGQAGLILERAQPVDALPGFFEGFVSVQDAGAQRAAELLAPASGAYVLDACAAPGGKTAHLLESADIELLALDIDAGRTRRIEDNVQRLKLSATVRVADCSDVHSWWDGRAFDAILADVPCSGSGVVRRHPDIKTLRRESDIRNFAKTQAGILDALWPLLKPGGTFLYATCSVFAEENSAQIDSFAVRYSDVERLADEQWLPGTENDGFYYALLRKAV